MLAASDAQTGLLTGKPKATKIKAVESSVQASIFNMTNMIIGAGVLALPYAFRAAGVIPATLICVAVWIASSYSFMLLATCAEHLNEFSYKGVAKRTYGDFAAQFSESAIMIYTIGNLIGRQIILGDLLPPLVALIVGESHALASRWFVMTVVTCVVLIPLSISPYIDSLKWSSLFGLMCMCYVVVLFVVYFLADTYNGNLRTQEIKYMNDSILGLMAFPLLVVSFTAHYNTMDMYWELKDRTLPKMSSVIRSSTVICLITYVIVGMSGYLIFTDSTYSNILVNLWSDRGVRPNMFVLLAFAAISVAVSFSFPLVCHGARNSVLKLFFGNPTQHEQNVDVIVTFAIVFLSLLIGLYVPDIGVVFAFMGSTVGVLFVYILPALFYIKILDSKNQKQEDLEGKLGKEDKTSKIYPKALLAFGTLIGVTGTFATGMHQVGWI